MTRVLKPGKDYIGVGCGALIFNDKGELLLLQRGSKAKNDIGAWQEPGGSVEFGETIAESIKREVREEVGVEIEILEFLHHTDHILKSEGQHWIGINAVARIKSGEPKIIEPEKHSNIGWFSLDNLPEKLTQPTEESVRELNSRKEFAL